MNIKSAFRVSFYLFILISLSIVFAGCEKVTGYTLIKGNYENEDPSAVAIILGNHANAMAIPDDVYESLGQEIEQAVYGGYACAIISDSTPTKIEIVPTDFFVEDARNPEILKKRLKDRTNEFVNLLKKVGTADSTEVDLLSAIREAKNALSSSNLYEIKDKKIIIVDTGISTSGDLDFTTLDVQKGVPEIESVVELLERNTVLPDLNGITVKFIGTSDGLAEVASPQIMNTTDKKYIKDLWKAIVIRCGANESIQYISAAGWSSANTYTEDGDSKFPYVSVVPFFHDTTIDLSRIQEASSSDPDVQPNLPAPPTISIKLESQVVGFMPDLAEYYNLNATKANLEPYASDLKQYIAAYPDETIWIVGTTATTKSGGNGSVELSFARAEKVKETLVELGVSEDKLITIGLGAVFPWHLDEFADGTFDDSKAQSNRAAWLLNSADDNEEFGMLIEAYKRGELLPEALERFSQYYG